jgi:toxin FitB
MSWLLDTNVLSELRKGPRSDAGVQQWFADVADDQLFTSVLVLGELRRGVESVRRKDAAAAASLERWLDEMATRFPERVLPVDDAVADHWGRLNVPNPVPAIDGLLAATALVHGMTLVTRNVADVASTGVAVINPFAATA